MVGKETSGGPAKGTTGDGDHGRRAFLQTVVGAGVASGVGVGSAGTATTDDEVFVWRHERAGGRNQSPLLADSTIYVPYGGRLYALDAVSGEQQWRFDDTVTEIDFLAVADGTVYVGTDNQTDHVYAVDAATGEEQWRFETPLGESDGRIEPFRVSSLAVENGIVYIGSRDTDLFALDGASGELQWRFETDNWIWSLAVVDGTAYVGEFDSDVYAVDVASREERWRVENDDGTHVIEAVIDGTLYLRSFDDNWYALDANSGEEQWRVDTGDESDSAAAIAEGTVYISTTNGNLFAVDASSGEQQWHFKMDDGGRELTVSDGTVYVGDHTDLVAVDAVSGEQEWRFLTDLSVEWLSAVDGIIYVKGSGNLYAVDVASVEDRLIYAGDVGNVYVMENAGGVKDVLETENTYHTDNTKTRLVVLGFLGLAGAVVTLLSDRLEEEPERDDREHSSTGRDTTDTPTK